MDNFWDYGPDYTSSGSDLSGDWGGYDQIYVDGNTGGLTDYGSFWDSPDYSYGDLPMYLDPNTAAYEAPVWLPEQPQFSFDLGSYLQPSSLSGLTDLGLIPSQIGGLDVSMAPYNDNYLSAANANALSLGLPFDANLNLSGDEAFLQTYMATGNPVVAEQMRRQADAALEERALENIPYNWGSFDSQSAEYLRQNYPELMNSDKALEWEINAMGQDALYNDVARQVQEGLISPQEAERILQGRTSTGGVYDFSSPEQRRAMAAQGSAVSGIVGKLLGTAAERALTPKERLEEERAKAQARALEQYNKQAAAKAAYENSGTGKALTGLQGALAVAQALMGKNKGATTTARGNQGQAFSPTYVGSSAPKTMYAKGGAIEGKGGLLNLAEQMAYQLANSKGLIQGEGGGQDDVVDVKAAPGEYVMDAEIVSALGDGNNEEGARKLDQMRVNIRKHKRTGGLASIPPKAKAPEQYMKKGK